MQAKMAELLGAIGLELEKAQKVYEEALKAAQEVAASASLSPSQSGDRFHSQGSADIAKERLETLLRLKDEVASGLVRFVEKDGSEFFLVKNVTLVPGTKLVSVDSPVGRKLMRNVD